MTRYLTLSSLKERLFSSWSASRPGVATTTCGRPRDRSSACAEVTVYLLPLNPVPDSESIHLGSRVKTITVSGFGSASEKVFLTQQIFSRVSYRKYDPRCSSRIRILIFYPSRVPVLSVKKTPDPGSLIRISNNAF